MLRFGLIQIVRRDLERVVWEREAEKEGACQGRARGFETSAVATLGCQKICPIEND